MKVSKIEQKLHAILKTGKKESFPDATFPFSHRTPCSIAKRKLNKIFVWLFFLQKLCGK